MAVLLLVEQQAAVFKLVDDVLVGLFDPAVSILGGGFVGELAVGADGTEERHSMLVVEALTLFLHQVEVDFTKSGGLVDQTSAALERHEVSVQDAPSNVFITACAQR